MCEVSFALTQGDLLYPSAVVIGEVGCELPLERFTLGQVIRAVTGHHVVHVTQRSDKICNLHREQVRHLTKNMCDGHGCDRAEAHRCLGPR